MQYVQLRAVHAVATHGGFSAAASALGLTQPAISDQVRRLEQDYGCIIFLRRSRRVELTEFGRKLVATITPIFEAQRQARALLSQASQLEEGSLSVIADAPDLAIALIASLRARHPAVRVSLAIANAETCLERVGSADRLLAVTSASVYDSSLVSQVLREDPLMALVRKDAPLAASKRLKLADLSEAGLVFREPRSLTQRLLSLELARLGIVGTPALQVDGREAMVEAVAAGLGVGVIAASEYGGRRGVRMRPITDCRAAMTVSLVARRDHSGMKLVSEMFSIAGETLNKEISGVS